jgi:hypothetical protein
VKLDVISKDGKCLTIDSDAIKEVRRVGDDNYELSFEEDQFVQVGVREVLKVCDKMDYKKVDLKGSRI